MTFFQGVLTGIVRFQRSLLFCLYSTNTQSICKMFCRACSQVPRMTSRIVRNNGVRNVVKRHSHDHAGTPPPPYVQRRVPNKSVFLGDSDRLTFQLSEHAELIWEDGVAPETAIDFDALHVSTGRAFMWWAGGMSFFFLLWEGVKHYDPRRLARFVRIRFYL